MKASELRRQSQNIINTSMKMFLATDLTDQTSLVSTYQDYITRNDKIKKQQIFQSKGEMSLAK